MMRFSAAQVGVSIFAFLLHAVGFFTFFQERQELDRTRPALAGAGKKFSELNGVLAGMIEKTDAYVTSEVLERSFLPLKGAAAALKDGGERTAKVREEAGKWGESLAKASDLEAIRKKFVSKEADIKKRTEAHRALARAESPRFDRLRYGRGETAIPKGEHRAAGRLPLVQDQEKVPFESPRLFVLPSNPSPDRRAAAMAFERTAEGTFARVFVFNILRRETIEAPIALLWLAAEE